jgi:hypothetical protein
MKINELLAIESHQKIDEVLPAALLGAARLAPMLARAAGGAAGTLGRAVSGANNATKALKAANSVNNLIGQDPAQQAKQDNKLKSTLSKLSKTFSVAGGPQLDVNRTAQTLTKPPTGKPDPSAAKNLEPLLPALSAALQNPQSADMVAQAIQTGVKAEIDQLSKAQQAQAKQAAKDIKPAV